MNLNTMFILVCCAAGISLGNLISIIILSGRMTKFERLAVSLYDAVDVIDQKVK